MLKSSTLERLEAQVYQAVHEASQGLTEREATEDPAIYALRHEQAEKAKSLLAAFKELSAAKSAEANLGMRRAILGLN